MSLFFSVILLPPIRWLRTKKVPKSLSIVIVLAFIIVLFTVFLGMYGGGEVNILSQLAQIPVSIVLGVILGMIPGFFLYRIDKD